MIVKFLAKSRTFKGVRYNTNKVEKDKGELMKVSGFGLLQGMSHLTPQDYINYLQMVSARNKRIVYPQLHAVISAKGRKTSKEELTDIADKWMKQMGYAEQPYLVIFHKDTHNHHVHIVSTRVDKSTGKKISSAFERIRAMTAINRIMKQDEKHMAKADLDKALKFNFQTKAQFMMILESKGYTLVEEKGKLHLIKFGKVLQEVDLGFLKDRKANYQVNQTRASQITALLHRYKNVHSPVLRLMGEQLPGRFEQVKQEYTSDLAGAMRSMFGIQIIFHGVGGKVPYGYSVLDHAEGNVFKGGEIMDKDELLSKQVNNLNLKPLPEEKSWIELDTLNKQIETDVKLGKRYAIENSDDFINDSSGQQFNNRAAHQLNNSDTPKINNEFSFEPIEPAIRIDISDDIDDEAIHGRNRHRKRQARTNTR